METTEKYTRVNHIQRRLLFFLLVLLLLALVTVFILAVVVHNEKIGSVKSIDCEGNILDVAIIGAGASGTYAAWKLSQKYNWNIHIFDANNRVGGRLFSVPIPGIKDMLADLGAMRFEQSHKTVIKLIQELGLESTPFTTPNSDNTLYFLRDHLLDKYDIAAGRIPYSMTEQERNLSGNTKALIVHWNNMIIANASKNLPDSWEKKCVDGKFTYQKGIYNAFLDVASRDAIDYLTYKEMFPQDFLGNVNYARWTGTSVSEAAPPAQMYTIKQGFQELAEQMIKRFLQNPRSMLHLYHKLTSVYFKNGLARLQFFDEISHELVDVCARKVVLGLPAEANSQVHFYNKDLASVVLPKMQSLQKAPVMKTYLAYDRPWWRTEGRGKQFNSMAKDLKLLVTDLPVGFLMDIGVDNTTGKAVLLSYAASSSQVSFWKPFQEDKQPYESNVMPDMTVTDSFINQINTQLSRIFNISRTKLARPYAVVTQSWYKAPYFTAWHDISAGYNFPEIARHIMKPVTMRELYIIGESFSDVRFTTEGALASAENLLNNYFGYGTN